MLKIRFREPDVPFFSYQVDSILKNSTTVVRNAYLQNEGQLTSNFFGLKMFISQNKKFCFWEFEIFLNKWKNGMIVKIQRKDTCMGTQLIGIHN